MRNRKRLVYALWIFRVLYDGGLVCMLTVLFRQRMALIWAGVVMIVIAVIVADLTVRCPACGKPLTVGRWPGIPRFCPNCGERLKEE